MSDNQSANSSSFAPPPRFPSKPNIRPTQAINIGKRAALILALALGVAGVVFICAFSHYHDSIIPPEGQDTMYTLGISMPPLVIFMMLLVVFAVNPLLARFLPEQRFQRRELLIVLAMWLVTGALCYASFANPVITSIGAYFGPAFDASWVGGIEFRKYLPPELFLDQRQATDFHYGIGDRLRRLPLSQVPWQAWVGPLLFWIPFMILAAALVSSLVQIVHRQWSKHELLTYPIGAVADYLLTQRPDRHFPDIYYNRLFWAGFGLAGFIFTLNGLSVWFPNVPSIPLQFDHRDLAREFKFFQYGSTYSFSFFRGFVHIYIIALAVLLPAEISLTCWLGWTLFILGAGAQFLLTGETVTEADASSAHWGMFAMLMIFIIFVGWREYARIIRAAFTRISKVEDQAIRDAAWACRIFILVAIGLVGLLTRVGMDWLVAAMLVLGFIVMTVVFARITAEIGFPTLWSYISIARALPIKLLGAAAIGPRSLALLAALGGMLDIHPTNTLAANETTYRKLEENQPGLRRWAFNLLLLLTALLAIGCSIFFHLWDDYSYGGNKELVMGVYLARHIVQPAQGEISRLRIEGKEEQLNAVHGLEKLKRVQPARNFWRYFLFGAAIIGFCYFMRLRFAGWPLHPLPLLFFNTWVMSCFFFSIMLGWLIKTALTKIGGGKVFIQSKPFFVGVILGQIAVMVAWIFIGAIYYFATGLTPPMEMVRWI